MGEGGYAMLAAYIHTYIHTLHAYAIILYYGVFYIYIGLLYMYPSGPGLSYLSIYLGFATRLYLSTSREGGGWVGLGWVRLGKVG